MRNGQLKPAYNVQIAANSEYITGIEAFSNWTDVGTFIPFMRKLELAHQQRYEEVATDAGYESLDNYLYLEANGQMSFIKPTNGKRNIRIELFFLALGFNLKKRWMKQQKSRLETHYSEKKASQPQNIKKLSTGRPGNMPRSALLCLKIEIWAVNEHLRLELECSRRKIGLLQKRILQQSLDYISERYCACLKTKSLKIQT